MQLSKDIRHGRHCVSALHVHLVFIAKYRRRCLTERPSSGSKPFFEKVCRDFQAQLVEMNGEAKHVHLLINYPPRHFHAFHATFYGACRSTQDSVMTRT
jgi:putative transposase